MKQSILEAMRRDWNRRAVEDAYYYAAFTRRKQEDSEFFESAASVLARLESELGRLDPAVRPGRALEIGCGPARLIRPLSVHFAEIHGIDVSDEMVRIAQRNLAGVPHAIVQRTSGTDLAPFSDRYFDFIYSYAVFQHIPRSEVVTAYLREAWRVLKPGGILTCQLNGLPPEEQGGTTWDGARVPSSQIMALTTELDCHLLALENPASQYMWITWRKRLDGRSENTGGNGFRPSLRSIRTDSGAPAEIPTGRTTPVYLRVEGLPDECDLRDLSATFRGNDCRPSNILASPAWGTKDVKIVVAPQREAGRAPLELYWRGMLLGPPQAIEVTGASGNLPVVVSLTDGVNALAGLRIVSRIIKVHVENLGGPDLLSAFVDGMPARQAAPYCVDEGTRLFDINYSLPTALGPGVRRLELLYGSKVLLTRKIHTGIIEAVEVFRGVPPGARLLEVEGRRATVLTVSVEGAQQAGDEITVDMTRLPFRPETFDGIVCRLDRGPHRWDHLTAEIRRVLRPDGAFYLELPRLESIRPDKLAPSVERGTGLSFQWARALGRSMAPRDWGKKGLPESLRVFLTLVLRVLDRFRGTTLSSTGRGFYFGRLWRDSAPGAMLNACTRCGRAHSYDQLRAAGVISRVFIFLAYLCPSCGCKNILTLDR